MAVNENIKRIRKEKGLTQKQLGDLCVPVIAESTIRRYELGKLNPKLETLRKVADALDVPISDLLDSDFSLYRRPDIEGDYFEYIKELNRDNKERHHLLIHHYDALSRTGRDSLMEILANMKLLNSSGQKEASKRVEELTEIPKYTQPEKEPPAE